MSNYRKRKGDQGERTVLVLLEQAGWIANNGSPTTPGVDVIAYWDWGSSPGAFAVLHAEAKNEPWRRRGRSYLGPIAAYWEAKGVLYRVFTHERAGWFVRAISYQDGRVRTLYMEPATVASCCLGGLLMAGKSPPSSSPPSTAKAVNEHEQQTRGGLPREGPQEIQRVASEEERGGQGQSRTTGLGSGHEATGRMVGQVEPPAENAPCDVESPPPGGGSA